MSLVPNPGTVWELLVRQSETRGLAPAILAPDRPPLTFAALVRQVERTGTSLAEMGIGRNGRIALAMSNGPDSAVAILSAMTWAACAPLNPGLDIETVTSRLSRLRADAVVVTEGQESAATAAARTLGVAVIRLRPVLAEAAGVFALRTQTSRGSVDRVPPHPKDVALLLQTSGTTDYPKIVPLTQGNLVASVQARARTMQVTPADRCLCINPMFTSTAILRSVLTPLSFGASVVCTPDFRADSFVDWFEEFDPTFFSANPTILAAILEPLLLRKPFKRNSLRFVSTGSSVMPAVLRPKLEQAFGVPVIQTYGTTETGSITQSPLEHGRQRASSVGLPVAEVAILGDRDEVLPPREVGEIVVRGPAVMSGYENDPEANRLAFCDGWFRTGDLGYRDNDGYVFLVGRLKELINRGGLKVSPREVDDALLRHPAVLEAAAFPVPHTTLGEDVAAAVVLRQGRAVSETQLRQFVAAHLARHQVPSRIVIVSALPKNALGKVRRVDLKGVLETHDSAAGRHAPRDQVDLHLIKLWEDVLNVSPIGPEDNFFELGGDSLLAARIFAEIERSFGRALPLDALWFGSPTVAYLADLLREDGNAGEWPMLVPIKAAGVKRPLFCVHTSGGNLFHYYALARSLDAEQPVFGLQARGVYGSAMPRHTIEAIAADCIAAMRGRQPHGPFRLAGYSSAGIVTIEMARQLLEQGERITTLALLDAGTTSGRTLARQIRKLREHGFRLLQERAYHALLTAMHRHDLRRLRTVGEAQRWASWSYKLRPYSGDVHLFATSETVLDARGDETLGWRGFIAGALNVYRIPGTHATLIKAPAVQQLASILQRCLDDDDVHQGPNARDVCRAEGAPTTDALIGRSRGLFGKIG